MPTRIAGDAPAEGKFARADEGRFNVLVGREIHYSAAKRGASRCIRFRRREELRRSAEGPCQIRPRRFGGLLETENLRRDAARPVGGNRDRFRRKVRRHAIRVTGERHAETLFLRLERHDDRFVRVRRGSPFAPAGDGIRRRVSVDGAGDPDVRRPSPLERRIFPKRENEIRSRSAFRNASGSHPSRAGPLPARFLAWRRDRRPDHRSGSDVLARRGNGRCLSMLRYDCKRHAIHEIHPHVTRSIGRN